MHDYPWILRLFWRAVAVSVLRRLEIAVGYNSLTLVLLTALSFADNCTRFSCDIIAPLACTDIGKFVSVQKFADVCTK